MISKELAHAFQAAVASFLSRIAGQSTSQLAGSGPGHLRVCLASPVPALAAQAPIHFADLNSESGSLITDILRIIVEKGYGPADRHAAGHDHYPGNCPGQQ